MYVYHLSFTADKATKNKPNWGWLLVVDGRSVMRWVQRVIGQPHLNSVYVLVADNPTSYGPVEIPAAAVTAGRPILVTSIAIQGTTFFYYATLADSSIGHRLKGQKR